MFHCHSYALYTVHMHINIIIAPVRNFFYADIPALQLYLSGALHTNTHTCVSSSVASDKRAIGFLGMTKTCFGATGLTSLNAIH